MKNTHSFYFSLIVLPVRDQSSPAPQNDQHEFELCFKRASLTSNAIQMLLEIMVMVLSLCCINALSTDTALGRTAAGSILAACTMPEKCNMFAFNHI